MPPRVVLDTNIIISGLLFGGTPRALFQKAIKGEIVGVTSVSLLAELTDILSKKFLFQNERMTFVEKKIRKKFMIVYPKKSVTLLKDDPDNRVLEAAVGGNCVYIITGDKKLLSLKRYKGITILSATEFQSLLFK